MKSGGSRSQRILAQNTVMIVEKGKSGERWLIEEMLNC